MNEIPNKKSTISLKLLVCYYIVSLFMLANGNLFSFIFKGLHLSIWRQLVFILGLGILIRNQYLYRNNFLIKRILKKYKYFTIITFFFAIITYVTHHYSIIRLLYSFWVYFNGVPFLIFPHIYKLYTKNQNPIKFYNIFIYLGLFSTLGLILDYILHGAITQFFFLYNQGLDDYSFENIGRYYFLTESPTSFGLFYCFCLICVLVRVYYEKNSFLKSIFLIISLSFLFGAWMTGSRQIVLAMLIEFIIGGSIYIFHTKDKKTYLCYIIVIGLLFLPYFFSSYKESNENLSERFSSENIKDDDRTKKWERGFEETCLQLEVLFFGNALGYTIINNVSKGEKGGYHYENTFFARISETGIIGLIIFLYPFIIILKNLKKINFLKSLILGFTFAYLIISFISPNGTHQTSQMVLFITLGVIADKNFYLIKRTSQIKL